jgi:LCP family protein required for cell wall assembly
MVEDELRATFARHEHLVPAPEAVRPAIEKGYRQRLRRRRVLRGGGAACVALVLAAFPVAASRLVTGPSAAVPALGGPSTVRSGALNFLMLGIDSPGTGSADPAARSDTVLLVHVPASRDRAYLVSVPRDLMVSIPADPASGYRGGDDKLGAAYAYGSHNGRGRAGGFQLTARTLSTLTGLVLDGGAVVTYAGLRQVVSALGGVDMCVDERTISIHVGRTRDGRQAVPFRRDASGALTPVAGVTPQVYQVGCQHLAPWQAVDYLRQRELITDGSAGRDRHARQFVAAVLKKLGSAGTLTDPVKLIALIQTAGRAITIDAGPTSLVGLVGALSGVREIVGTAVPTSYLTGSGGPYEQATAAASGLFNAVRQDDLDGWIAAHPS